MGTIKAALKGDYHNVRGIKSAVIMVNIDLLEAKKDTRVAPVVFSILKSCFSKFASGQISCRLKYEGSTQKFANVRVESSVLTYILKDTKVDMNITLCCSDFQFSSIAVNNMTDLAIILSSVELEPVDPIKGAYNISVCFKDLVETEPLNLKGFTKMYRGITYIFDNCKLKEVYAIYGARIRFINHTESIYITEYNLYESPRCLNKDLAIARLHSKVCCNKNSAIKVASCIDPFFGGQYLYAPGEQNAVQLTTWVLSKLEEMGEDSSTLMTLSSEEVSITRNNTIYIDSTSDVLLINALTSMGRVCSNKDYTLMYQQADVLFSVSDFFDALEGELPAENDRYVADSGIFLISSYEDSSYFPVDWYIPTSSNLGRPLKLYSTIDEW